MHVLTQARGALASVQELRVVFFLNQPTLGQTNPEIEPLASNALSAGEFLKHRRLFYF